MAASILRVRCERSSWRRRPFCFVCETRRSEAADSSASTAALSNDEDKVSYAVTSRLTEEWKKNIAESDTAGSNDSDDEKQTATSIAQSISDGYDAVIQSITNELSGECVSLSLLYARKLILHILVTLGKDFLLSHFINDISSEGEEIDAARKLWTIIEKCCSQPGWLGEAGAMAIAAEALGLGISTGSDSTGSEACVITVDKVPSASGGISQLLSSAMLPTQVNADENASNRIDPSNSLAACAEAALGSDGGGSLVFLRNSLQAAAANSSAFRKVLIAAVRRSVRLLSSVESDAAVGKNKSSSAADESNDDGDDDENQKDEYDEFNIITGPETAKMDQSTAPDARLASFVSGLLLSKPVRAATSNAAHMDAAIVVSHLLEAWSVGLLSASMPWRMVCAMTASGMLDMDANALHYVSGRTSILAGLYRRLPSMVARRAWAERAAIPICSRYVQAYAELLSSSRAAGTSDCLLSSDVATDAAMPKPLPQLHAPSELSTSSWEWEEGFISSDAGFETWTGSVEVFPVNWQAPSRSAVRTLMDGGDGPPMLREGCKVMRGTDWAGRYEDGQDLYDAA